MNLKWKFISEDSDLIGWRKVSARTYELPNGKQKKFDINYYRNSACVLPITKEGDVVLVKQYRPGPVVVTLELPGGIIDPGEEPIESAARELVEETGFVGDLQSVGSFWLDAYSTGKKHAVLARNCAQVRPQRTEDDEFIEVVLMRLGSFRKWLESCDMPDAASAYRALQVLDLERTY